MDNEQKLFTGINKVKSGALCFNKFATGEKLTLNRKDSSNL